MRNTLASDTQEKSTSQGDRAPESGGSVAHLFLSCCFAVIAGISFWELYEARHHSPLDPSWEVTPAPLVMQGGDPYIRALMRTISASESNDPRPYSLLYGGGHIADLSRHPDLCIPIVAGPNIGDCTTAAGRYQFLTTTWLDKARQYHPDGDRLLFWESYSFSPRYQDEVTYAWLSDTSAWGADLGQLLRDGRLEDVLWLLSATWTSLGYGIESNSMTDYLPDIYYQMLQEELANQGGF